MRTTLATLIALLTFAIGACGKDDKTCDPPCPAGGVCIEGSCEVENCCSQTVDGKIFISVAGNAIVFPAAQTTPAEVGIAALSPTVALTNPNAAPLATTQSAAVTGAFELGCFDVTDVQLGMVILTDDSTFDGGSGNWFPTGTGVKGFDKKYEKQCVEGATVMAVSTQFVAGISQLPGMDPAGYGFVMGMVLDANKQGVAGAQIKTADGTDLNQVYYPHATDPTDWTGTSTAAHGMFILPHGNFGGSIVSINAFKAGATFTPTQASSAAGFCFFAIIQP